MGTRQRSMSYSAADQRHFRTYERPIAVRPGVRQGWRMALILVFLLGVGNFTLHRAVMDGGRGLFAELPPTLVRRARIASLLTEFVLLCGALYAARAGHEPWLWAYAGYSLFNLVAAWLLIARKI
ncbi:hypothetical protein GCM10011411_22840 [Aurantiacibacter arachoides]|nr:hypothetical protein GCM10011411_22840 [Aurantiacibacter arachoides]